MRPIIQSAKHIVQHSLDSIAIGTRNLIPIAVAKDAPNLADASDVAVGTTIKAVYCELWIMAPANQPGTQVSIFFKGTADVQISALEMADLHGYVNKKNIFYTTMGLIGDANSNPIPILRQWIKIPKGKQRMGLGDRLLMSVLAQVEGVEICGQFTYKAYT